MTINVLIVDDEPQMLRALRINLQARGFGVISAATGEEALGATRASQPDVLVLDLGLPDIDGVEVIRTLRTWTAVPIIVLSGRTGSTDKVEALDAGADDYVTKPFTHDELLARIRAVTRRHPQVQESAELRVGRFVIDLGNHAIVADDSADAPHLTRTEWRLLEALLRNPGKLMAQRQLLRDVWGPTYGNETHYLRQYMTQLRHKLEPEPSRPRFLLTEPGMGYRFQP